MSQALNFLVEDSENVDILTERTEDGSNQLFIEGIFCQAEKINGNKRFYKRNIMENAVQKYIDNYVGRGRALGELKHPEYPIPDPSEAAILVKELGWDGNNVRGKALVLNTPKGSIVKGLLEGGFKMGVSTRGLGSLRESRGIKYVQDDFMLTAVDCVDNPSGPDCYVNAVNESRWMMSESTGSWVPVHQGLSEESGLNEELFFEKLKQFIKNQNKQH